MTELQARDLDELKDIVATLPVRQRAVAVEHHPMDEHRSNKLPDPRRGSVSRNEVLADEHSAGELDSLGKMSADAVRAQYEAAAKAFEVMGEEVKDRIDKLEASLAEAATSMKLLADAAAAIREQGKLAHMQIAEMSSVTKHINTMCSDVMKKVGRNGT